MRQFPKLLAEDVADAGDAGFRGGNEAQIAIGFPVPIASQRGVAFITRFALALLRLLRAAPQKASEQAADIRHRLQASLIGNVEYRPARKGEYAMGHAIGYDREHEGASHTRLVGQGNRHTCVTRRVEYP